MEVKYRKPIASIETNYMKQQEITLKRAAKRKKLLIRRLSVFLILSIALCYMVTSHAIQIVYLETKQAEKRELELTLANLEKKQSMLENEIVKLNDDEHIAELARSEYFLSDKGEIIFNIPKEKEKDKDKKEGKE